MLKERSCLGGRAFLCLREQHNKTEKDKEREGALGAGKLNSTSMKDISKTSCKN